MYEVMIISLEVEIHCYPIVPCFIKFRKKGYFLVPAVLLFSKETDKRAFLFDCFPFIEFQVNIASQQCVSVVK